MNSNYTACKAVCHEIWSYTTFHDFDYALSIVLVTQVNVYF